MSIVRWSPFREVEALNNEMNRLFSRFSGTTFSGMSGFNSEENGSQNGHQQNSNQNNQWLLPMDVVETPDAIKLRTALPGIKPDDVHIEINENLLTVSAQRHDEDRLENGGYRWIEQQYGSFSRSVTLPRYVDTERIEADLNNGILELVIPKKESAKPRRVQLKTATNNESQPKAIEAGSTSSSSNSSSGMPKSEQGKEVRQLAGYSA